MHSLLELEIFEIISNVLHEASSTLSASGSINLHSEPTLIGILGLAQIESAVIDAGIAYRRQFLIPGEVVEENSIVISSDSETRWDSESKILVIGPIAVQSPMGNDMKMRTGVLESTSQAAACAALMAPEGHRVRRQRGWLCGGQWLRDTMDQVYDPIWATLRDHLRDEGSVRTLPLPEVESIAEEELPGLSSHSLNRLRKSWPTMDYELRSSALSELMVIVSTSSNQSVPRIEELGWHRVYSGSWPTDLASMLYLERKQWPMEEGVVEHASNRLDALISTGHF